MAIRQWRLLAGVGCAALALSACRQILPIVVAQPPKFDAATAADIATAQKDADVLFAALSATTGCSYAGNTAQFDLVDKDLAALSTQAGTVPNNSFTLNGAGLLQKGFDKFRAAAAAKPAGCLPPGLAEDKKTSFDGAAANLLAYENAKPKG